MSKLVSPTAGKIQEINVKVGQVINEDDEVLIIDSLNAAKKALKEVDEYEEYPRYQMLYEYFTCSYFSAI
ncbi:biotin/lipoyl-binding protein [Sinanaerobacter chloroacetimidivorans]|jgi:multidrug efflux pump subunit AcrA (membrane-fusion protein)|uniref:Biotin/lipoyl-binding protein n=1 Tax=Sinanaerobacter chloroacetimidivorans TaxID=2818044 RepID=A0A8J7VYC3_9FIRM|nr:biotin/lipoyl-binding protein [Sinanaerobacter chloroacetimidivorans]MBR0596931.1 biotin/lipoyl-binding protein [Sinanaerobacter chloroacetimidivorans]